MPQDQLLREKTRGVLGGALQLMGNAPQHSLQKQMPAGSRLLYGAVAVIVAGVLVCAVAGMVYGIDLVRGGGGA